jgi:hypothetical protein
VKSLDRFLPNYEFSTRHEVSVAVQPALADRALRGVTFREVPLLRGLGQRRGEDTVLATMVPRAAV